MKNNILYTRELLQRLLAEDLGQGDLSVQSLPNSIISGYFEAKSDGILAGQTIPPAIYQLFSNDITYTSLIADGQHIKLGDKYGKVYGPAHALLSAERLILNLTQRMSGIATATNLAINKLADPTIKILDTRKTVPGLRYFDKIAVQIGGGLNHRMGLYDSVMIKDNHWQLINNLPETINNIRLDIGPTKTIEVEVETLVQLKAAITSNVDIIMFDNQHPDTIKEWQRLVPNNIKIEVSGGITLDNLHEYAHTGVDFISLGYLTNNVTPLDLSFELV
ncbi:nicotinate-nucleotide pyrophosphorylase [Paucilactobacillus oligofermentans DSM 15707 = LMG 22743]|uniref:Probable nicotinate-nucleotide pyrophosphorylase [carboxylating] n=1 Tax=Paucilactobacillus oligofermentans DSM 15707 = LMG 22743 TaxID=1423778 RepID=A0A0R1RG77_9LACO|nr:carboxylating nicotinate-nucleotide diphosphorylase [Paucilactobacillus oligofermentans]KRL55358.1 nicotinate-nucleotide pyrophosphorylase [Paucilactobacillus oligofermentans DSM 15707 = LMG 22743]CUS25651.1 Nicotinate-nucleotide diphosphorylase [carboxylating] [Paucilactobacillus oligofermentans DSM 15707 = LMG 22743]